MKRYCMICGDYMHTLIGCPESRINAELSVGEWIHVYILRRFGKIGEAASHYRISGASMSMALRGARPLPRQLLKDAGVTVGVTFVGANK